MLLQPVTTAPFSRAARSIVAGSSRGSGTGSPWTRSRATPPSGNMVSRTWVKRSSTATSNSLRVLPATALCGTRVTQSAAASSAGAGYPSAPHASTDTSGG